MTTHAGAPPAIPPMPRISVVLLGAAVLDLALLTWAWYVMNDELPLAAPNAFGQLLDATPFVLAASLIAGRDRWAAGRSWLLAAAVTFAAAGLIRAASRMVLAVALQEDTGQAIEVLNATSAGSLLANLVVMGASVLAAAGLWRAGPSIARSGWRGRAFLIAIAVAVLVTLAATVTAVRWLYQLASLDAAQAIVVSPIATVVYEFSSVPLAVLGMAAIRRLPRRYLLPELLIGIGAVTASVTWWLWSGAMFLTTGSTPPIGGILMVATASALHVTAMATVAVGFFTARVSVPGEE